ncbi:MAG: permease [Thiotrichales bacterium]|nr:MAG: permease [Thiotrichales bacterium]
MLFFEEIMSFIILGLSAGFFSGLLGIGGGVFVVPGLMMVFSLIHIPDDLGMHFAVGSSLCIMIITAFSLIYAHLKRNNIMFPIFKTMLPFVIVGAIVGAVLTYFLHSGLLHLLFSFFLFFVAFKMLRKSQSKCDHKSYSLQSCVAGFKKTIGRIVASVIGIQAGLLGISGASVCVPFLLHYHFPMPKASGTAIALTLPIAITGSLAFMFLGNVHTNITWSTGYIYWPSVLVVAPFSVIMAQVGAKVATKLSTERLRSIFGILLFVIGTKMFASFVISLL